VDQSADYGNGPPGPSGISCPTASLCVAVDGDGNAIVSTDPTGGPGAWTVHQIDDGSDYECVHYGTTGPQCIPGLTAVACPAVSHCVAIDWAGGILSSTDPTGAGPWGGGEQPASESYSNLTCPRLGFCLLSQLYSGELFALTSRQLRPDTDLGFDDGVDGIWCKSARMCFATGTVGTSPEPAPTELLESLNPSAANPSGSARTSAAQRSARSHARHRSCVSPPTAREPC
jgi:hypothetical protein